MSDQPCERCVFIATPNGRCLCRAISFVIPGEPASKARARFTNYGSKVRAYTPAKTLTAEAAVRAAYLSVAAPGVDPDQAFGVSVEFLHETGQRRDVDNMLKLILDGLNKIAWPDDVQVTEIQAAKRRVPKGDAETRVAIYDLGQIQKPRGKCIRCGSEFVQYASTSSRKYCSRGCANAAKRKPLPLCGRCGATCNARGATYCSAQCAGLAKRKPPRSCPDCGGPIPNGKAARCRACHFTHRYPNPVTLKELS